MCNDPHVQDVYPIYTHQAKLVANGGVNMDYFVDDPSFDANFMNFLKFTNNVIEIRATVRQFQPYR